VSAALLLVAKGALSGGLVAAVLAASRRGNAPLAGLLVSAPIVTTLTIVFVGIDEGGPAVHRLGGATAAGVSAYVVFPLALWALCRRGRWGFPLLLATLAWAVATTCLFVAIRP
jgi:uncharacterized membrane protein (GlpM family)